MFENTHPHPQLQQQKWSLGVLLDSLGGTSVAHRIDQTCRLSPGSLAKSHPSCWIHAPVDAATEAIGNHSRQLATPYHQHLYGQSVFMLAGESIPKLG